MRRNLLTVFGLITVLALGACDGYPNVQSQQQLLEASDIDPEFAASILLNMSSQELTESLANGDVKIALSDVVVGESTVYAIEDASGTITYAAMSITESRDADDELTIDFARDPESFESIEGDAQEPEEVLAQPVVEGLYDNLDRGAPIALSWNATALDMFRDWTNDPAGVEFPVLKIVCVVRGFFGINIGRPVYSYHFVVVQIDINA